MNVCTGGVGNDRWPAPCEQRGAALSRERKTDRGRGRELALSWAALPPSDREVYLLGHSPILHHTPNRCLLSVCTPSLTTISVFLRFPSPSLSCCSHSSSSSLNQTVTGGGAAFHANGSLPSCFLRSLSFPVLRQTDRVPRLSPWISCSGVWSDTTWPLRQCEFFRRLKLSGGQEFTFGAVDVGQGHPHTHTICRPKPAGRLGYLVGITCFHIDLVTALEACFHLKYSLIVFAVL